MRFTRYLTTRVAGDLQASDQIRLLVSTFIATAASVVVVHQFLPGRENLRAVVTHALGLALAYAVCVFAVSVLVFLLVQRSEFKKLQVWHLWGMSLLAFNLGFFLVPLSDEGRVLLHPENAMGQVWGHYGRLVPLWALVTYLFIQAHTRRALEKELEELQRVNNALSVRGLAPSKRRITLSSGKTTVSLDEDRVSHISVEDHYCYIHYRDGDQWKKTDVAMPLKKVLREVPPTFLLVHRSHIVNPVHLERIERSDRAYRLVLPNDVILPISRHRLQEVLPKVQAFLADR